MLLNDQADDQDSGGCDYQASISYSSFIVRKCTRLKIFRSLTKASPEAFSQNLVETLLNMSIFYLQAVPDKTKSIAYAQEARDILKPLIQQLPHLQEYLDAAEQVLEANNAKPEA